MLSKTLYKQGMKGSWKQLLLFAAVLTMYFTVIISMFDPELGTALNEFAKAMPELMAMVGMNPTSTTMIGFMSAYLYGFIMLVIPMVYTILAANRLVARLVDRGSMAYLLSAPVTRRNVAVTQLAVLLTGIVGLVIYATLLGIGVSSALFPGELEIGKFLLLNLGALGLQLFIGGICFLASCACNDTKYSVGFGAGIPALGFIIQMMANYGGKLEKVKYLTFFTLFDVNGVAGAEPGALIGIAVLFVGAALLYLAAITVFSRKDMPI